jgi:hypothetical protein
MASSWGAISDSTIIFPIRVKMNFWIVLILIPQFLKSFSWSETDFLSTLEELYLSIIKSKCCRFIEPKVLFEESMWWILKFLNCSHNTSVLKEW